MFTLQQAISAIEFKPEFTIRDKGEYSIIDYNLSNAETFIGDNEEQTLILQNLRGTAFDNKTGRIIRLGYQKFHNYGEFPEVDKTLNFDDKHLITQKLDGSLIYTIYNNDEIILGTRAGVTDVSNMAVDFLDESGLVDQYYDFIRICRDQLWATPCFEFCSRKNRVVIDHPEDKLVLTGIRYIESGAYVKYENMVQLASDFGIPVVKRIESIIQSQFSNFKQSVTDYINDEGVVIRFESGINFGHMLKMKSESYCRMHRAVDSIKFAKDCVILHLNHEIDDVIPLLSVDRAEIVQNFIVDFDKCLQNIHTIIHHVYDSYKHIQSQKEFALAIADNRYKKYLFSLRNGKSLIDMLLIQAKNSCSTQANCKEFQDFIGMTAEY